MIPLAERMRPQTLAQFVGQEHLVAPNSVLNKLISSGEIPSMIFWGPPGVGKTTLASIISKMLDRPFFTLSAINSGVKDVREVIEKASTHRNEFPKSKNAILFIDEIHRFNKAQQDSLLGAVERGIITLIGATTENPSFEVISPLLSRCQVFIMKELPRETLLQLLKRVMSEDEFLKTKNITIKEDEALLRLSGGDARKLLNLFELVVNAIGESGTLIITNKNVQEIAQQKLAIYDKSGEQHYDIISAFIKSIRGSDPNAALYWLARMIKGGENLRFIARRMVILASEDIGNANPTALVLATTCFQAVDVIGYPESRIILAQTVTYLACSSKSNASYMAIEDALKLVDETGDLPVPLNVRNAPTKLMKELGYGDNYQYDHSHDNNFAGNEFLPEKIAGTKFFEPGNTTRENELREFLKKRWGKKYGY